MSQQQPFFLIKNFPLYSRSLTGEFVAQKKLNKIWSDQCEADSLTLRSSKKQIWG
jgi:hypothetical protein